MNLDSQVVNLELSKRLKELGVKQESYAEWLYQPAGDFWMPYPRFKNALGYSAFAVSELLELLPHRITIKEDTPFNSFRLRIEKSFFVDGDPYNGNEINLECVKNNYIVNYRCDATGMSGEEAWLERTLTKNISDENCANACAKIIIYLLENGLMKNE